MATTQFFSIFAVLAVAGFAADLASGPPLPHRLVRDWAQLPPGWNFGEATGVDVDREDNVWVFNRGPQKVIQFDKHGRVLSHWNDIPIMSAHGLEIDPDGNVWLVDVKGHAVFQFDRFSRMRMVITNSYNRPGDNDSKYFFNEPTGVAFAPDGSFYVSDGYVNSRVVKYNRDGEYLLHWGRKGAADGEFNLVHDVCVDRQGLVYVADRTNARVQIFDPNGKFLRKWTHAGSPYGLHYSARENMIYMVDGLNNRVVKLDLEGKVLGTLGSFGKIQGKFDAAHHISVDSEGSIYVVEIRNWRVQKFSLK
jgi:DNA-binding beta-propeller fold protein YncE